VVSELADDEEDDADSRTDGRTAGLRLWAARAPVAARFGARVQRQRRVDEDERTGRISC